MSKIIQQFECIVLSGIGEDDTFNARMADITYDQEDLIADFDVTKNGINSKDVLPGAMFMLTFFENGSEFLFLKQHYTKEHIDAIERDAQELSNKMRAFYKEIPDVMNEPCLETNGATTMDTIQFLAPTPAMHTMWSEKEIHDLNESIHRIFHQQPAPNLKTVTPHDTI